MLLPPKTAETYPGTRFDQLEEVGQETAEVEEASEVVPQRWTILAELF